MLIDLIFISLLIYFAFLLYKKFKRVFFKVYIFFLLWFIAGILIHLQIITLDLTVANRWFYFPMIGLLGMLGVLINVLKINFHKKLELILTIIILVILSAATLLRSYNWRNMYSLASNDLKYSKDDYALENELSLAFMEKRSYKEALPHAEKSVKLFPYFTNYDALGTIYLNLGENDKALEAFNNSLKYGDYYDVYEKLAGMALLSKDLTKDEFNSNKEFIKEALNKFPGSAKLWLYLAILEYQNSDIADAKKSISKAFSIDPNNEIGGIYNTIISNHNLQLNIKIGN